MSIEGLESVILCVIALSKDTPLIIRVATQKDYNEPSPLCLLKKYPIVRNVGDTDDSWDGGSS